jgi:hypothetical protein
MVRLLFPSLPSPFPSCVRSKADEPIFVSIARPAQVRSLRTSERNRSRRSTLLVRRILRSCSRLEQEVSASTWRQPTRSSSLIATGSFSFSSLSASQGITLTLQAACFRLQESSKRSASDGSSSSDRTEESCYGLSVCPS